MEKQIRDLAEGIANKEMVELKKLQKQYWGLHAKIATESFTSHWEQMDAIRKLSQLGLAVHAKGEAYRAINKARCN